MALKLLYRSTFIDVDDSSDEPMRPRSQSQPPCSRNLAACAPARLEETQLGDYVAALGHRAEQLDVLIRSNDNAKAKALLQKAEEQRRTETASTFFSASSLHDSARQLRTPTSISSVSSMSPATSGPGSERSLLKDFHGFRRTVSCQSSTGMSQAEPDMGKDTVRELPSQGSSGHPEICRRPCLYFARGDCQSGSACGYCHLDHAERISHWDKRNREMLKRMTLADLLPLVLKLARKRAQDIGMLREACGVLQVLENWSLTKSPAITDWTLGMKRLLLAMQKVHFSALIMLVLKKRTADESQADADFNEQLQGALSQMGWASG
eukprot:TRINITY_DN7016_c0_g2_i5.p1 TRINITY_DN7016_c0_g2~~TRINITY_DN7016_c0_g2_i5.p1  ORF type:complete len:323 (-),score=55.41 TRINITY_DN7016_c0_g2_i5:125-1093(-)